MPLWARAVASALLALVATLLVLELLERGRGNASADVTFARDMSAHHAQAVQMSMILHARTHDPQLRTLALDIALTQQAQLGMMHGWLQAWNVPIAGRGPIMRGMGESMGMATAEQIAALSSAPLEEAETLYLQLMLRHHQGGILMAEGAALEVRRPYLRELARKMVEGQRSETGLLEAMLRERRAQPLPAPEAHRH
nr:DUF305 domain-containing protein [Deinobacterium chartae]